MREEVSSYYLRLTLVTFTSLSNEFGGSTPNAYSRLFLSMPSSSSGSKIGGLRSYVATETCGISCVIQRSMND